MYQAQSLGGDRGHEELNSGLVGEACSRRSSKHYRVQPPTADFGPFTLYLCLNFRIARYDTTLHVRRLVRDNPAETARVWACGVFHFRRNRA